MPVLKSPGWPERTRFVYCLRDAEEYPVSGTNPEAEPAPIQDGAGPYLGVSLLHQLDRSRPGVLKSSCLRQDGPVRGYKENVLAGAS